MVEVEDQTESSETVRESSETVREAFMKRISGNPRFQEARTGKAFVIAGHPAQTDHRPIERRTVQNSEIPKNDYRPRY
jgi:hypothetical protein